jgi:hypothetical protein
VINENPCGLGAQLKRAARGHVIKNVSEKINRTAEHRLRAIAVVCRVDASISKHSNVVGSAIGFDEVIVGKMNVVVVDIDGRRAPLRIRVRRTISRNADAIVEIGDCVMPDDVPGALHLDGKKTS